MEKGRESIPRLPEEKGKGKRNGSSLLLLSEGRGTQGRDRGEEGSEENRSLTTSTLLKRKLLTLHYYMNEKERAEENVGSKISCRKGASLIKEEGTDWERIGSSTKFPPFKEKGEKRRRDLLFLIR